MGDHKPAKVLEEPDKHRKPPGVCSDGKRTALIMSRELEISELSGRFRCLVKM